MAAARSFRKSFWLRSLNPVMLLEGLALMCGEAANDGSAGTDRMCTATDETVWFRSTTRMVRDASDGASGAEGAIGIELVRRPIYSRAPALDATEAPVEAVGGPNAFTCSARTQ